MPRAEEVKCHLSTAREGVHEVQEEKGETREEVTELIREAIELHLEGLRDEGAPPPRPTSTGELVEVQAA